ncbi:MAG: hypothetical protein ACFFC7_13745 [Candidatus Hermodarchaeota archaeon]
MVKPTRKHLEELVMSGLSANKIAAKLGVDSSTLYRWLREYGLPTPSEVKWMKVRQGVIIDYLHLKAKVEIERQRGICRTRKVTPILREAGFIDGIDPGLVKRRLKSCWVPIPSKLDEIIQGFLLGDATIRTTAPKGILLLEMPTDDEYLNSVDTLYCLSQTNKFTDLSAAVQEFNWAVTTLMRAQTSAFRLHKDALEWPWLKLIAEFFRQHGCACTLKSGYQTDKNGVTTDVEFKTVSTLQFDKKRQLWYVGPKNRTVPRYLVLTPLMMLCWFVDDGCAGPNEMVFCTDNFPKADVQFLSRLLSREVGVPTTVAKSKKIFRRVRISKLDADDFFAYLDLAPSPFLRIAKTVFPWKFDCTLPKKEVYDAKKEYVDEDYFQAYMKLLEQLMGKEFSLILGKQVFPWRFEPNTVPVTSHFSDCVSD